MSASGVRGKRVKTDDFAAKMIVQSSVIFERQKKRGPAGKNLFHKKTRTSPVAEEYAGSPLPERVESLSLKAEERFLGEISIHCFYYTRIEISP